MSCLQLTLICIVLQSNIAQIFSAPISDCKSHTHTIDNKEIKVTSHVNVELPDSDDDHPTDTQNPVQNHEIQFGDDSSMHIKIDISITPEMLGESSESETSSPTANLERTGTGVNQNALQKTLTEPLKEIKEVREEVNDLSGIKPDEIIAEQLTGENKLQDQDYDLDRKDMPEKSVIESVGEKNEKASVGKNLDQRNPLVNGKITDKNLENKLNDDLNIGSKSIDDESRQAKGKEILAENPEEDEDEDGEVGDVGDEDNEEDGGFEELEDDDENLDDENEASVQGVDKKDKKRDKVEEDDEDDENMQEQEQGEENEDGDEIEGDDDAEDLDEDAEDLGEDDEDEEK